MRSRLAVPPTLSPFRAVGQVTRVVGLEVEVRGIDGGIGDMVVLGPPERAIRAEVVAISGSASMVMPLGSIDGLCPNDPAELVGGRLLLPVGDGLRGRVVNAFGEPIDGHGPVRGAIERVVFDGAAPSPMSRRRIEHPLPLGVRALDALLPCGRGQRIGVFAGSGVGKSTILGNARQVWVYTPPGYQADGEPYLDKPGTYHIRPLRPALMTTRREKRLHPERH